MKVLLFVQNEGDKRPVSVGKVGLLSASNDGPRSLKSSAGEYRMTWQQGLAYDCCDRWWLVECENAEAGRVAISYHEASPAALPRTFSSMADTKHATILASGGKR